MSKIILCFTVDGWNGIGKEWTSIENAGKREGRGKEKLILKTPNTAEECQKHVTYPYTNVSFYKLCQ